MSGPGNDPLELIFPERTGGGGAADGEGAPDRALAARVVHLAGLLASDARRKSPGASAWGMEQAWRELRLQTRSALADTIEDLLRHLWIAALPENSFGWPGSPRLSWQSGWAELVAHAEGWDGSRGPRRPASSGHRPLATDLPEPNEPCVEVAARLLSAAADQGLERRRLALWRARLRWIEAEPEAAEEGLEGLLEELDPPQIDPGLWREVFAARVELALDRARPLEARALLERLAPRGPIGPRLEALQQWCACLCDGACGDRPRALPAEAGPLPRPLLELRERVPRFLPALTGRPAPRSRVRGGGPAPDARDPADRRALGASVLALLRFEVGVAARRVWLRTAPGLDESVPHELNRREGAFRVRGEPEHELVVGARSVRLHAEPDERPRGSLAGSTRALELVPILDGDGEVQGWLHAEFEHHLLPGTSRMRALRDRAACELADCSATAARSSSPTPRVAEAPRTTGRSIVRAAFHELVARLGMKTAHRRWWGLEIVDGELQVACEGGSGLPAAGAVRAEGRAIRRAIASGGGVLFREPDPVLAFDARSASGIALPVLCGEDVLGILAVESERRRDFRPEDIERLGKALEVRATGLRVARFRRWHCEGFGQDPHIEWWRPSWSDRIATLLACARASAPVLIRGAPGTGRTTLARWLHFESARRDGALVAGRLPGGASLAEDLRRGDPDGSMLLESLEEWSAEDQRHMVAILEQADGGSPGGGRERAAGRMPRLIVTCGAAPSELVDAGCLRADLAARLGRLGIDLDPLADRREEIPGLVRALTERFARESGRSTPVASDEALACLWRQPWPGNLRELENFAYQLVALARDDTLDADHVGRAARHFGRRLLARLPSRHPRRIDLLAALEATRNGVGSINKTRAAHYLGWDPDTLVARMTDAGLH